MSQPSHEDLSRVHQDVLSKAICVSAIEGLLASNMILKEELQRNDIKVPAVSSVLERSAMKQIELAVNDAKLVNMRQVVQELVRLGRDAENEDAIKHYGDAVVGQYTQMMEGVKPGETVSVKVEEEVKS